MWPGRRFGAPYFIHYGRNGGQVTQDAANRYVYALSNNGFWKTATTISSPGSTKEASRSPRRAIGVTSRR